MLAVRWQWCRLPVGVPPRHRREEGRTMTTATFGSQNVDWEERLDIPRLREARLARLRAELERSDLGTLLAIVSSNIRYMSATPLGTSAIDKQIRFCLITRHSDPIVGDFGSAAMHHQLYAPGSTRRRRRRTPSRSPPA